MRLRIVEEPPADECAADRKERLVNSRETFISNPEATKLVQPGNGAFDHPPVNTEPASVPGAAPGKDGYNPAAAQFLSMRLRIVAPVSLHRIRPAAGTAALAPDWRDCFNKRDELCHVMPVCRREDGRQGNAPGVGNHMMLTARFPSVRRIRAGFRPPKTARTEPLSTTARDQSILSASRSLASRTSCTFCQTPASCQARRYRQQLMPEPHPISWGSICHGMPLLKTKRIPASAFRLSTGLRPGNRKRLGFCSGSNGSMASHISSGTSSLAMCGPLPATASHGISSRSQLNSRSFCYRLLVPSPPHSSAKFILVLKNPPQK
jgi:hypothetical protein